MQQNTRHPKNSWSCFFKYPCIASPKKQNARKCKLKLSQAKHKSWYLHATPKLHLSSKGPRYFQQYTPCTACKFIPRVNQSDDKPTAMQQM